jgi:hypothetical protein
MPRELLPDTRPICLSAFLSQLRGFAILGIAHNGKATPLEDSGVKFV